MKTLKTLINKAKKIILWFKDNEDRLSDGYSYYTNNVESVIESATEQLLSAKTKNEVKDILDNHLESLSDGPQYYGDFNSLLKDLLKILNISK